MGVEPTLDQEAGRATVLKTVQAVPQPAPQPFRGRSARSKQVASCAGCARLTHGCRRFGCKNGCTATRFC